MALVFKAQYRSKFPLIRVNLKRQSSEHLISFCHDWVIKQSIANRRGQTYSTNDRFIVRTCKLERHRVDMDR